jgi:uncharacterized repeat protein (TIGR01451 family)
MKRYSAGDAIPLVMFVMAGCTDISGNPPSQHSPESHAGGNTKVSRTFSLSSFSVVTDVDGANDVASQTDLTQFGIDSSPVNTYAIFWSWDATNDWTGTGQTADACAHFDSDGDGSVNMEICVQIENTGGNPSVIGATSASPLIFTCDDSRIDRCGASSAVANTGGAVQLTTEISATDPFANLDPDQDWPDDATVQLAIAKTFLPAGATLINVCSYPSALNGGNNNPIDCIRLPAALSVARLTLAVASTTALITTVGQVVDYSYLVTNTGNVSVSSIIVTDDLVATVTCPQFTLAASAFMTCSGNHSVTVAESAGDSLRNHATVDSDLTLPVADTLSIPISVKTARIVDARTSCRTFVSGSATPVESVTYTVKNGLFNQVSSRSVTYFLTLIAPSTSFTASVTQANESSWPPLRAETTRGATIYDSACRKGTQLQSASFDATTGAVSLSVNNATAASVYYVAIEYVLTDLLRQPVNAQPTAAFSVVLNLGGAPIEASRNSLSILPR